MFCFNTRSVALRLKRRFGHSFHGFGRIGQRFASLMLLFCVLTGSAAHLLAQNQNPTPPPKPTHRKVLVRIEPDYPEILRNGHFEGQVHIRATVLASGKVSNAEILGGNPALAQYAAEAVMRWKYAPAPAQTTEDVWFNFLLH